jgi:CheY-like chemotaxis protein
MGASQEADSVQEAVFLQELHDALLHLRDLPFRRTHPLSRRIAPSSPPSTSTLQQFLLDSVERLRPPSYVAFDSPRWRRYRYLKLRYVEGAPLEQVVMQLGISERQARREHHAALQELAALLIQQSPASVGGGRLEPVFGDRSQDMPSMAQQFSFDSESLVDLDSELMQVESAQSTERIDLLLALEDALDLAAPLARRRSVVIEPAERQVLPPVVGTKTVLRQILLNILTFFIGIDGVRHLRIEAYGRVAAIDLRFLVTVVARAPRGLSGTRGLAGFAPPLAAANHLVDGQGGSLHLVDAPTGIPSVHLVLPTVDATLVLIVDDNPGVARLFRRFLRGTGFRLVQARNGFQALDLTKLLQPDVIVLDLMMPVQDGWDLLRSLRADVATASIPVVACSVLPERDLALALGARDFLAKPVTPDTLLAALEPFRRPLSLDPQTNLRAVEPAKLLPGTSSSLRPTARRNG